MYLPPEGKLIHDIESVWNTLEKCEHGREVALKDELIRLVEHGTENVLKDNVGCVCNTAERMLLKDEHLTSGG